MSRVYPRERRRRPPHLLRRILGWTAIVAGLLMMVLPGPGLLVLAAGIAVLGRRDPTLRRGALMIRLGLRRLSRAEQHSVRVVGQWLRARHRKARTFVREQVERSAHGQPLSRATRFWIGVMLIVAVMSIGLSIKLLLP